MHLFFGYLLFVQFTWMSSCAVHQTRRNIQAAVPTPIQAYLSDAFGYRFHSIGPIQWQTNAPTNESIHLDLTTKHQQFDGVGGSFLRSGAILLNQLPAQVQSDLLEALFHPTRGAGFSIGKVPIAATDFMPPVWYTYNDYPAYDTSLSNFSIAHDLTINGTVQFIQRASQISGRKIRLESTMDFPPWWMLNTTFILPESDLNTTTLGSLALYYLKFWQAFALQGIPIEYITLFNEDYTSPSLQNYRDLLVNHVGPLFRSTPGSPKITWIENYGRCITSVDGPKFMNLPGVRQYVDMVFYHGYDCGDFGGWKCTGLNATCPHLMECAASLSTYLKTYAQNLKAWMTELCYATEFNDYPAKSCPKIPRLDFEDAMQWGRMLYADFAIVGASGWIYWNLILDPTGGPWLVSPEHNDPDPNPQQPVVVADVAAGKFYLTGVYYALAHFGRFVPSGSIRVEISGLPVNLYSVAFLYEESRVIVWLMNDSEIPKPRYITLYLGDYYAVIPMTPTSMVTLEFTLQ